MARQTLGYCQTCVRSKISAPIGVWLWTSLTRFRTRPRTRTILRRFRRHFLNVAKKLNNHFKANFIRINNSPMTSVPSLVTLNRSWLVPVRRIPLPPSFIQNKVGVGLPAATQSSWADFFAVAVASSGVIRKIGGA